MKIILKFLDENIDPQNDPSMGTLSLDNAPGPWLLEKNEMIGLYILYLCLGEGEAK